MLLIVYGSNKIKKATLSPNDSSTQVKALQADNVLTLSFTLYEYVALEVNDYVDYMGERYWLTEGYLPNEKNTQEWVYDVKFYGIESLIKRFLVLNNGDPVFTLTAPPREHVALVVASINAGMGNTDWKVGSVEGTDNIVVDYEGLYCHDALKEIASKSEASVEWWVEGQTVNLCRCEQGEEVVLGYNKGLIGLERDTADNVKFYTRLFPIGSSRNIDPERYGHSRLQLPGGAKYVDINTEKYGIIHHFEKEAFADIYPRRIGTVSSVRSEEVTGEDGNPFTIYYFKDDTMNFDPNDYEISGLVKRVSFQEGSELAGLGTGDEHYFEVNFNSETREFEIITIWPYADGEQLPGGNLIPKVGNKYILWNLRMPDEYYPLAEADFLEAVNKYNARHGIDVSVYKGPTDHTYIEDHGIDLFIGRRVRLESKEYFPGTGYRNSRITRITRKVNLPSAVELEISDAVSKGFMEKVEDSISEVKNYTKTSAGSLPDLIRCGDETRPTDNNLFSALRTIKEFVSKLKDDVISGSMTFLKNVIVRGITKLQDACFGDFVKGSTGAGVYKDEQGNWHIEGDYFHIRKKLTAEEVEVQHTSHIGGKLMNTSAGMICVKVEEFTDYWRCYFKLEDSEGRKLYNQFRVDDQGYVETFNLVKQADGTTGNHFLWRKVVGFGEDYIDLSKSDCAEGSDAPFAGDSIVQLGNRTDPTRQGAIIDASAGSGAPYIRIYKGINSYTLPKPIIDLNTEQSEICARIILQANGKDLDDVINDLGIDIEAIKKQTDKQYIIWFGSEIPTLENYPVFEWTEQEYDSHVEDLFYLDNETDEENNGRAWRFKKNGDGIFSWNEITDKYVLQCLKTAADAKETAQSKKRVFVLQPGDDDEYDVGDMWVNATYRNTDGSYLYDNDTLVCKTAKAKGVPFSISHWKAASKVTTSYIENMGDSIILAVTPDIEKAKTMAQEGIDSAHELDAWARQEVQRLGGRIDSTDDLIHENQSAIQVTQNNITALTESIQFEVNEAGEKVIRNISKNGLVTDENFAALLAERIHFDANGSVTNIDKSGLVLEANFATLFAAAVEADGNIVKQAQISAFITQDEVEGMLSNITLEADRINFIGKTIINGNFVVDKNGALTVKNMTVTEGSKIAGLKISGNALTNEGFNNDAYIVMRNDNNKTFAGLGGAILPASLGGVQAVARFENGRSISNVDNIALYCAASGANGIGKNYALWVAKGQVWMPGVLFGGSVQWPSSDQDIKVLCRYNFEMVGSISATGSSKYGYIQINHNLGHTNYFVLTSACDNFTVLTSVAEKTATSFKIYIYGRDGSYQWNKPVSFAVIGMNN